METWSRDAHHRHVLKKLREIFGPTRNRTCPGCSERIFVSPGTKAFAKETDHLFLIPKSPNCHAWFEMYVDFDRYDDFDWDILRAQVVERCRVRVSQCPSCETPIRGELPNRCSCGYSFGLLKPAKKPGRRSRTSALAK
jgi:hypothetical protein